MTTMSWRSIHLPVSIQPWSTRNEGLSFSDVSSGANGKLPNISHCIYDHHRPRILLRRASCCRIKANYTPNRNPNKAFNLGSLYTNYKRVYPKDDLRISELAEAYEAVYPKSTHDTKPPAPPRNFKRQLKDDQDVGSTPRKRQQASLADLGNVNADSTPPELRDESRSRWDPKGGSLSTVDKAEAKGALPSHRSWLVKRIKSDQRRLRHEREGSDSFPEFACAWRAIRPGGAFAREVKEQPEMQRAKLDVLGWQL